MTARQTKKGGAPASPRPARPRLRVIQGGNMEAAPVEKSPVLLLAITLFCRLSHDERAEVYATLEAMIRDRRDPHALALVQLLTRHGGRR